MSYFFFLRNAAMRLLIFHCYSAYLLTEQTRQPSEGVQTRKLSYVVGLKQEDSCAFETQETATVLHIL
jgi:hypothetical protein